MTTATTDSAARYEGRRALITGGGSGIGQATVFRLLSEGGSVVAADISEEGLKATVARAEEQGLAARLSTVVVNIAEEDSARAGVAAAVRTLGGLDVLVNAAGILRAAHTHEMPLADWNKVLTVNLTGTFLMTREALPELLKNETPVIVNFSSTSASFAHPYMAAYAASKGAIQSFTHAIALEYSKQNLRAVSVCPGSISSGMTDASGTSKENVGPGFPEHDVDWNLLTKLLPAIGHGFAGPEAVASVVAMLASEDGKFITGTEIRIDGGTHM
ncbi:MAG: SDR family oxidoreductase [Catenulispora sp.]|nr:SDR family oxidoreductase [Catenulispora sp.]